MSATKPRETGLLGPVSLFAGVLLLLASPLMRGGNRHIALIPLEFIGLAVLLGLFLRWVLIRPAAQTAYTSDRFVMLLLAASPLLLAAVQLTPLPAQLWAQLPGRAVYSEALMAIGAPAAALRPMSLGPSATSASLLAGIPVAAALLLGYLASLSQLRLMVWAFVAMAFAQVILGLLQAAGGQHSPLFFGTISYGPPIGSFANRNHFANYLAMALAGYLWLAYESLRAHDPDRSTSSFTIRHRAGFWVAGALVLVVGILMPRSRGAALFGLTAAALGLAVVALRVGGRSRGLRSAVPLVAVLVLGAGALIGFGTVTSRISVDQLAGSAGFRGMLARTSLDAALAFWPWGSGWGTYDMVYPRFQPSSILGFANHAHMDYIEMLLEGGIFFLVFAAAFLWLAGKQAFRLAATARRERTLDREAMASALCGLGLLGFLLHCLVDFNMRIPANAILAALLAGAYLRPLHQPAARGVRQPDPAEEFS